MYVSNQTRQRRYRKERNEEEENTEGQQIRFYNYLSKNALDDDQASELADLATNVVQKIVAPEKQTGLSKLVKAITDGKFDDFMRKMEKIPVAVLSPSERVVQQVIKSQDYKNTMNEHLAKLVEHAEATPKKVVSALIGEMINNPMFKKRVEAQGEEGIAGSEAEGKQAFVENALANISSLVSRQFPALSSQAKTVGMSEDEQSMLSAEDTEELKKSTTEKPFTIQASKFNTYNLATLVQLYELLVDREEKEMKTYLVDTFIKNNQKMIKGRKIEDVLTTKKPLEVFLRGYLDSTHRYKRANASVS
jgi:hypothetical protein